MLIKAKKFQEVSEGAEIEIRGRVLGKRDFGKIKFFDVRDESGRIQVMVDEKTSISAESSAGPVALGDIIGIRGRVMKTHTGQKSLGATSCLIYTRCLSPLPDLREGVSNHIKYNERALDLLTSDDALARFQKINGAVSSIRSFLYGRGYQEVDTGILQRTGDSAPAGGFETHCIALKRNLFLRKSKEQRMKQLLVGGLEKIFEIGKSFRNCQITRKYHPEINGLELYHSYSDWEGMLGLTKDLLNMLNESWEVPESKPHISKRVNFYDILNGAYGLDCRSASLESIASLIPEKRRRAYSSDDYGRAFALMDLAGQAIEMRKSENLVLMGVPKQISVLSATHKEEPSLAQEFRYFVKGVSFCYGNTELTDVKEQEKRIADQAHHERKAVDFDNDPFLKMMRLGLPPTGGLGIGLDRLFMIYTGRDSVKDVIYYPL
ncbi:MAG: amino acid--tRNA ligase-related protein [Nanoarchaeota archaeon]